jgi:aromatic ring-cleaving dioxygenase
MHTYHVHVYFAINQTALASRVRENILKDIPQITYAGQLIPISVGPHTMPMFELHVPASMINYAKSSIDELREGLSVLIHPVQQDELDAHTKSAVWLGTKLELKLEVLS